MTLSQFRSLDDAAALEVLLSQRCRTWAAERRRLAPRRVNVVTTREGAAAAVLAALRGLPDPVAEAAGVEGPWRDLDLVDALRAWGWAANEEPPAGSLVVRLNGIWDDFVYPGCFAALVAVAPYVADQRGEPWIFSADSDDRPLFAIAFRGGCLSLYDEVEPSFDVY